MALAAVLFLIGALGMLLRRNALVMFMCIELMLNAVNLTLISAGRALNDLNGQVAVFFILVVAAAEVVVGLAIIVAIFRRRATRVGGRVERTPWLTSSGSLIALPLAGALFLHFFGRYVKEPLSGWLASAAIGGAFVIAAIAAVPFIQGGAEPLTIPLWEWMPAIGASFELLWDPLAALMALVVTGVGTLIHVFAIGYMHGDDRFHRFFTNLNLFAASMLTLVLAGNFAMLFLGWELVGLCSYLLISFWYTRPTAAAAAKKAFIVNRIGDFGFMVGLMLVFAVFGTLSFAGVFERAGEELTGGMATAIGLLLLVGAAGKSAQIPLYVWLPDAMEGPTPVSALIHAATMVTAGVYVIARSAPIFEFTPIASTVVATVGALTAIWAATIALAQSDIKRVLAYSTICQLGFMFLAVGARAYVAGVFHLMTHAFFKALLFLGAGSVIHAMSDEQDMHEWEDSVGRCRSPPPRWRSGPWPWPGSRRWPDFGRRTRYSRRTSPEAAGSTSSGSSG